MGLTAKGFAVLIARMSCLNCMQPTMGRFCVECGQKTRTARLTIFGILHDFFGSLTHAEEGFLKTVKDMTIRPGEMIRSYLKGHRAHYVSASKYLIFILFLAAISLSALSHKLDWTGQVYNVLDQAQKNVQLRENQKTDLEFLGLARVKYIESTKTYQITTKEHTKSIPHGRVYDFLKMTIPFMENAIAHNAKLTVLMWIPMMSLLSFLVFRKWRWNLAEHVTAQTYLFAHTLLLFCLATVFLWIFPAYADGIARTAALIAFVYYLTSFVRLAPDHIFRTGFASAAIFGLSGFLFVLLVTGMVCYSAAQAFNQAMRLPFP